MVDVHDPWDDETKTIALTAGEVIALLAAVSIAHAAETGYSPDGWLRDRNLIDKLARLLGTYSTSNTGDGIPK